jgi:hypothetical protein
MPCKCREVTSPQTEWNIIGTIGRSGGRLIRVSQGEEYQALSYLSPIGFMNGKTLVRVGFNRIPARPVNQSTGQRRFSLGQIRSSPLRRSELDLNGVNVLIALLICITNG